MGLFDMIHCHYPLPEMQDQSGEFQTKSLGRHMKHYVITYQGRLMLDLSRILGHLEDEQNSHWGLLNGCNLPLRPMVADWVRGLEEEFGCPVTPEDDAELNRRIEQLDSRVPVYHDMPYTGEVEFYDRCPVTGKLYIFVAGFQDGLVHSMVLSSIR